MEVAAAFLEHSVGQGAQVRILALSGSHELAAGVLLSEFAPHDPAKKYVIAVHVGLRLDWNKHGCCQRWAPKFGAEGSWKSWVNGDVDTAMDVHTRFVRKPGHLADEVLLSLRLRKTRGARQSVFGGKTSASEAGAYFRCDQHGDVTTASVEKWIDETDLRVSFLAEATEGSESTVFWRVTQMSSMLRDQLQLANVATDGRPSGFARIEDAIAAIRAGEMVIVADDEDRENEGDLTMAAEKITPEAINFMAKYGRGLICLAMTPERLDELEIPLMVPNNGSRFETAFCVSIEAKERTTTGISAADRAATVLAAIDPATKPADLVRPGHVFPLRARNAGVLVRAGQTEAAVDLARLAGLSPAGVICEIMNDDGTMARVPELREFALRHRLPLITVADLITYRLRTESMVKCVASTKLPTEYGEFRLHAFENQIDKQTHVVLVRGDIGDGEDVLVRVHSQCLTGDVLRSMRCDCGAQLDKALCRIATEGRGVLLYLNQEGRGIGLANKIRAYSLQDEGLDTVEANERLGFKPDQRDYGIGVQILREIGVRSMRLLSNNPRKLVAIEGYGLSITEWLPLEIPPSPSTLRYLTAKRNKLGHVLNAIPR